MSRRAATIRSRRGLILLAVVSMLVYLAVVLRVDAPRLLTGLQSLGMTGAVLVLGCSLFNYGLRFWRWQGYLRVLGHRLPTVRHLLYYIGGFGFTVSPGKAGEAVRSLMLKSHGVPYADSLAALFAERLLDLLAICALAALTAGSLTAHDDLGLLAGAGLLALTWLLSRPLLPEMLSRWAFRRQGHCFAQPIGHLAHLLRASAQLLRPRQLYPALLLSMIAWGAEGYALYWLGKSLGVALTPQTGTAIYAVSVLAGAAAFFMPAGLGGMEAAMTALLMAAGSDLHTAFIITALCRLATLWFAVMLGLAALLWLELRPHLPLARGTPA